MKVSVFGVGYVGCVTAACLAREGHDVVGVDVDAFKVRAINEGRSPFFEPGLSQLVGEMVAAGKLRATVDHAEAILGTDVALICVGTPTRSDGSTRLDYLLQVFSSIAEQLRRKDEYFVVALRSTVLPAAFEEQLIPLLERNSGKSVGRDIGFVYNPEFLREGVALKDFHDAPWTIIGSWDSRAGEVVASLYQSLTAPLVRTDPKTAALVKYFSNAFHALKVVFGNEVGSLCREMGVDGGEMMRIFSQDTKLNISHRYLKPGFAFGGSCLPKDLKAMVSEIGKRGLSLPVLESILPSNEEHLRS
jgi:GDP-mannose 6-dehydrogenase